MKKEKNKLTNDLFIALRLSNELDKDDYLKSLNIFSPDISQMYRTLLLENGSLIKTFEYLRTNDNDYDKYIFLKLLSIEEDLLIKHDELSDNEYANFIKVSEETLGFIFNNIFTFKKELNIDESIIDYFKRIMVRSLFIDDLRNKEETLKDIYSIMGSDNNYDKETKDLYLRLLFLVAYNKIEKNSFELIDIFLDSYNYNKTKIKELNCYLFLFSFLFYYYSNYDFDYKKIKENKIKKNIEVYLDKKEKYGKDTLKSFRDFINDLLNDNFNFTFKDFLDILNKVKYESGLGDSISYYVTKMELKEFAYFYYLDFLLNSNNNDYKNMLVISDFDDKERYKLINKTINRYFDNNGNLRNDLPNDFVSFYKEENAFINFIKEENDTNIFSNFIYTYKKNEILEIYKRIEEKYYDPSFIKELNNSVNNEFKKFYGYFDENIDGVGFSMLIKIQAISNDCQFEGLISYINSDVLKADTITIERNIEQYPKSYIRNLLVEKKNIDNNLTKTIKNIMEHSTFTFVGANVKEYIQYLIRDKKVENKYIKYCNKANSKPVEETLFNPNTIILDEKFRFNYEIIISLENPTGIEILKEIEHFKVGNKIIYEGCIMSQDEIANIIRIKLLKYKIDMKFSFKISKGKIINFT